MQDILWIGTSLIIIAGQVGTVLWWGRRRESELGDIRTSAWIDGYSAGYQAGHKAASLSAHEETTR